MNLRFALTDGLGTTGVGSSSGKYVVGLLWTFLVFEDEDFNSVVLEDIWLDVPNIEVDIWSFSDFELNILLHILLFK